MPQTDRNRPLYMISVAADLAGLHPQTLRIYESKGLVTPQRTSGNTRMYSQADVERLELITRLTDEGINLAGVPPRASSCMNTRCARPSQPWQSETTAAPLSPSSWEGSPPAA